MPLSRFLGGGFERTLLLLLPDIPEFVPPLAGGTNERPPPLLRTVPPLPAPLLVGGGDEIGPLLRRRSTPELPPETGGFVGARLTVLRSSRRGSRFKGAPPALRGNGDTPELPMPEFEFFPEFSPPELFDPEPLTGGLMRLLLGLPDWFRSGRTFRRSTPELGAVGNTGFDGIVAPGLGMTRVRSPPARLPFAFGLRGSRLLLSLLLLPLLLTLGLLRGTGWLSRRLPALPLAGNAGLFGTKVDGLGLIGLRPLSVVVAGG